MVSKIEIIAHYISLGLDIYFIVFAGLRLKDIQQVSQIDAELGLLLVSACFALLLFILDITTLQNFYLKEKQRKADERENKPFDPETPETDYMWAYVIDAKLEMLTLTGFIAFLMVVALADNPEIDQAGVIFNIVLAMIDYAIVALRTALKLREFSEQRSFDVLGVQDYENLFPLYIVPFGLFALLDGTVAVCRFPFSFCWSVKALFKAPWFPKFLGDTLVPILASGVAADT